MERRNFLNMITAGLAVTQVKPAQSQTTGGNVFLEKPAAGKPHTGKVLAAIQPHSDDIPIYCGGTVAKLVEEGYTGYLIRATNDDMGDDVGEPGTIGENVLRNERETRAMARALGISKVFDLNYNNHRMSGISQPELQLRLIFLFRLLKVDTIFCYDPWGHDEENPDHYVLAQCVEAACWMAGREHDYPEHMAAGLQTHAVKEKYYYARRPEVNRVVDISGTVDKKVEANRMNRAKGPGGGHGTKLRKELAAKGQRLPLLDGDEVAAERAYIKEFMLDRNRQLGQQYGVGYAEAFHYIGTRPSRVDEYIRKNAVPLR
ncbi:MAG: PIG-L family deacetylase [Acidobacteriia bacterium]|nr:PIG-L family deacetylase [Terriglobia bacterium]